MVRWSRDPGFAERLRAGVPKDRRGRSLADLDLATRLMRYPLSYMVYTEAFDGLAPEVKDAVYRRLFSLLRGRDRRPRYAHLRMPAARAAAQILRETMDVATSARRACDNARLMTPPPRAIARILVLVLGVAAAAPLAAGRPRPQPAGLPLVCILATGGTISGKGATSTSLADYKSGALRGEELVAAVPEIAQVARVEVEQIANISSTDITTAHWLTLAKRINAIFDGDPAVAGVVVTHGTNTLEETAYFLNLTVKHDRPVVVVGAMRPASAISADGPLNLLNAVRTAVSKDAVGKGTLVVLNDEVNAARDATKTNTYRVETFRSGELGLLGYVDADKVALYRAPCGATPRARSSTCGGWRRCRPWTSSTHTSSPARRWPRRWSPGGVQGIVIAGTGAGGMSTREREALKALLSGPPASPRPVVVRSNRTGNGRVLAQADDDGLGMVPADNLSPQKARVLLMLALTRTRDVAEIRRMFAEY